MAKRKKIILSGLVLFGLGVLVLAWPIRAAESFGLGDDVLRILTRILEVFTRFLGGVLTMLVQAVIWIAQYTDFVNARPVVAGWVIVRDVANMFFIVVLLLIAFGTILGQEEYHYKKLLPKLLILAVLVNFSRTIMGVFIDFSQVIMLTFVNGFKAAAGGNFANLFKIADILKKAEGGFTSSGCQEIGIWEVFGAYALAFGMVLVSIVTIFVIFAVLALRIIMLWLLTILSPVAFLAGTFPQGQKYYAQWWEEFKNQTMAGPMLAFFIWLALITVGGGESASTLFPEGKPAEDTVIQTACSGVGSTDAFITYIIGIFMLLAGVQMSQQMGGAIAGVAGKAKSAATRALRFGGKALAAPVAFGAGLGLHRAERALLDFSTKPGGGVLRRAVKYATPTGWKGFLKRGEVLLEESRKIASAEAEEESNIIFTRGKRRLPLREVAEHGLVGQYAKDFSFLSKEAVMRKAVELETLGGPEGERARAAIVSVAAHGGFLDDIARMPVLRQKLVDLGRQKYGYTDGTFYNKEMLQELLMDYMTGAGVGSGKGIDMATTDADRWQFQLRMITALEEPGKQTKHWEYLGHARYNPEKGKYEVGNKEWLKDYALEEFGKLGDRDRTGAAPHVFHALRQAPNKEGRIDAEDSADTYGTIGEAETAMIHAMAPSAAREPTRIQRRVPAWSLGTEIHETADPRGNPQVQGNTAMADYVSKFNDEINSDYVFAMYGAITNKTMKEILSQKKFNIVDQEGNLIKTIEYKGKLQPPREEESGGTPAGGTPAGGGAPAGGAAPTPAPAAPAAPSEPAPVGPAPTGGGAGAAPQQIIQQSTIIQTSIKPQMGAVMRDIARPGFVENQPIFRAIRKLIKDLNSEISGLERGMGVEFGELSKKLVKLDTALPSEGASVTEIRDSLSRAGLSEDEVRRDLGDIFSDISK
ncbi:hypothetical protein HYW17_01590 [Candidatus Uhrbacteria bacterium]|nr:hypothetical protein [Candidatus Uhrbacteria bacterium]